MLSLSDQVDKQLAELNQALDALEASVRRVRRFLEARPSYVEDVADATLKRRSERGAMCDKCGKDEVHSRVGKSCSTCNGLIVLLQPPSEPDDWQTQERQAWQAYLDEQAAKQPPRRWGEVYDGGQ